VAGRAGGSDGNAANARQGRKVKTFSGGQLGVPATVHDSHGPRSLALTVGEVHAEFARPGRAVARVGVRGAGPLHGRMTKTFTGGQRGVPATVHEWHGPRSPALLY